MKGQGPGSRRTGQSGRELVFAKWKVVAGSLALAWLAVPFTRAENYHIDEGVAFYAYQEMGKYRKKVFRIFQNKEGSLVGRVHGFTLNEGLFNIDMTAKPTPIQEESGIFVLTAPVEGAKRLYEFRYKNDVRTIFTVSEEGRKELLSRPNEFVEIDVSACFVFPPEFRPGNEPLAPVHCLRNPFSDERLYTLSKGEIDDVLSVWKTREERMLKELAGQLRETPANSVIPVGRTSLFDGVEWRFVHIKSLGQVINVKEGAPLKAKGEFVRIDVSVTRRTADAVRIKAPDLLIGNLGLNGGASQVCVMDSAATAAHVQDPKLMVPSGALALEPDKPQEFQMVFDIGLKTRDVALRVSSPRPNSKEILLLDTGR